MPPLALSEEEELYFELDANADANTTTTVATAAPTQGIAPTRSITGVDPNAPASALPTSDAAQFKPGQEMSAARVKNGPVPQDIGSQQDGSTKVQVMSIAYSSATDPTDSNHLIVKYELRLATIAYYLINDAFGEDGLVNFNPMVNSAGLFPDSTGTVLSQNNQNQAASGFSLVQSIETLDANTSAVLTQDFAYWMNPGGSYTEAARGMTASIEADEDGDLSGCAISGAALGTDVNPFANSLSIRQSSITGGSLKPEGFFHPQFSTQNATKGSSTGSSGNTYAQYSAMSNMGGTLVWEVPLNTDAVLAEEFASSQNGRIITRQCFKQNPITKLYEIDTTEIKQKSGFELLRTGDAASAEDKAKFVGPPALNADGGVGFRPTPPPPPSMIIKPAGAVETDGAPTI
jgi:hypothetical protein